MSRTKPIGKPSLVVLRATIEGDAESLTLNSSHSLRVEKHHITELLNTKGNARKATRVEQKRCDYLFLGSDFGHKCLTADLTIQVYQSGAADGLGAHLEVST